MRSHLLLLTVLLLLFHGLGCGGGADGEGMAPTASAPPAADPASVLFRGDFGGGDTSEWTEAQETGEGVSIEVLGPGDDPPPGVGHFGRFRLDSGDERAEVYRDLEFREGDDLYFRFLVRFGDGFPAEGMWQLFWQLHHAGDDDSPPLALTVAGPAPGRFLLEGSEPDDVYWNGPEIENGRWHEFVVRVNHSTDPAVGFVELWHDGVSQILANGDRRLHTKTLIDELNYPKVGYYRDAGMEGDGVVDIADYRIWR